MEVALCEEELFTDLAWIKNRGGEVEVALLLLLLDCVDLIDNRVFLEELVVGLFIKEIALEVAEPPDELLAPGITPVSRSISRPIGRLYSMVSPLKKGSVGI